MTSQTNVVILAAGLGTRMKSKRAKVLHRAGGLTLIEHVVQAAGAHRAREQRHGSGGAPGRSGASASGALGRPFCRSDRAKRHRPCPARLPGIARFEPGLVVVLYGDCPLLSPATLTELVRRQAASDAAATLITTRLTDPTGYGRIIFGETGETALFSAIVEQKPPRPRNSPSRSSTPASIVSAPTCCGSTWSKSGPTIRLTNII